MTVTLPTLPLPLVGALALLWLALRAWRAGRSAPLFLGFILACAGQSALIALIHHYGIAWLAPAQPVTAALIPPLAWLALQGSGIRRLRPRDALHLLPAVAVALAVIWWPAAIDGVLVLTFVGHGVAILLSVRPGADALPLARLQGGEHAARLWRMIALGLILSGVSEVLIVAMFVLGRAEWIGWIIGGYSAGLLLALGALSLSRDLSGRANPDDIAEADLDSGTRSVTGSGTRTGPGSGSNAGPGIDRDQAAADAALVARLSALLDREPLYLDPDLTLARLARRLQVPAKALSAAINRQSGENVSRFVNRLRIAQACARLKEGATVTEAMLASGFNTKSNFNREFRRVTGQSPSAWRG